jgi:hypothetical protein
VDQVVPPTAPDRRRKRIRAGAGLPLTEERFRTIVAEVAIRRAEHATAAGLPEHSARSAGRAAFQRTAGSGVGAEPHGGVVVLGELAEVSVVLEVVVDVGAVLGGLEVVDAARVVDAAVEVAVDMGALVSGTEVAGPERVAAGDPEPPWLATVPAGTGRTRRYRASTARKVSTSRRVEVRSLPCSSVGGSRPGITRHRYPAR